MMTVYTCTVSHFNTPDWRRTAEAPTRGVFFPPFLGLHPMFASTFKSLDPIHLQAAFSSGRNWPDRAYYYSTPEYPINLCLCSNE